MFVFAAKLQQINYNGFLLLQKRETNRIPVIKINNGKSNLLCSRNILAGAFIELRSFQLFYLSMREAFKIRNAMLVLQKYSYLNTRNRETC